MKETDRTKGLLAKYRSQLEMESGHRGDQTDCDGMCIASKSDTITERVEMIWYSTQTSVASAVYP